MSKLLLRAALTLVVLFVLFEVAARLFFPWPQRPGVTLELNNRVMDSDGNALRFKEKVKLEFDADFVRNDGWTPGEKPAGTVRVLCLGGWATMGILQNAGDTWWGQLRQQLGKKGLNVQIAAMGSERVPMLTVVNRARPVIDRLKPDVIIANFGFDDVTSAALDFKYTPNAAAGLEPPAGDTGLRRLIMATQTGRAIRSWRKGNENAMNQNEKGRTDFYVTTLKASRDQVQQLSVATPPPRDFDHDPLKAYLDALKFLKELASTAGASLILTGEPSLHDRDIFEAQEGLMIVHMFKDTPGPNGGPAFRPAPAWVASEMDRYSRSVEKFAADNKLPWIDLNGKVGKLSENFYTDVMLTDKGAADAASLLLPTVEPVIRERSAK